MSECKHGRSTRQYCGKCSAETLTESMPKPGIEDIQRILADMWEKMGAFKKDVDRSDVVDVNMLPEDFAPLRRLWRELDSTISLACRPDRLYGAKVKENEFGYEEIPEGLARKLTQESKAFNRHKDRVSGLAAEK